MEYKYFIEFLGTLVLVFAHFFTHANPYVMGMTTFAVYTIGQSADATSFSPLTTTVSYFLGRLTSTESLYAIAAQYVAVALIIVTFKPLKSFIENG
jgi:hypothetical protein